MDSRIVKLAENLVNYSVRLQKGEKVLIEFRGTDALPLVCQIVKEVYKAGGLPFVQLEINSLQRELLLEIKDEQLNLMAEVDALRMKNMDAYIGIGANANACELYDVPVENINRQRLLYDKPVHNNIRLGKKWVVLRYPTNSMAQLSNTSLEAFEDFYFDVCTMDYKKMSVAMDSLVTLMEKTDKVRITGKGTDVTFSIKDIPVIKCDGQMNIPDGEVYTAPVKNSVNGVIQYNTPSENSGFTYENVRLEFKDGKIINAEANDTERINKVFDIDEGARYIGEFAIGVNPYILKPMNNILFDEKIMGSFHFTPGNSYDDADNTNRSSVHWDLVCIQTEEYGGGEIYFDDVLIRKNGLFVIPELQCLNPENLK